MTIFSVDRPRHLILFGLDHARFLRRTDNTDIDLGRHVFGEDDKDGVLDKVRSEIAADGSGSDLRIPDQLVRVLSVPTSSDDHRSVAEASLLADLPIPLEDLRYRWQRDGDRLVVAAVETSTLAEATAFARDHGLDPRCFSIGPQEGCLADGLPLGRIEDDRAGEVEQRTVKMPQVMFVHRPVTMVEIPPRPTIAITGSARRTRGAVPLKVDRAPRVEAAPSRQSSTDAALADLFASSRTGRIAAAAPSPEVKDRLEQVVSRFPVASDKTSPKPDPVSMPAERQPAAPVAPPAFAGFAEEPATFRPAPAVVTAPPPLSFAKSSPEIDPDRTVFGPRPVRPQKRSSLPTVVVAIVAMILVAIGAWTVTLMLWPSADNTGAIASAPAVSMADDGSLLRRSDEIALAEPAADAAERSSASEYAPVIADRTAAEAAPDAGQPEPTPGFLTNRAPFETEPEIAEIEDVPGIDNPRLASLDPDVVLPDVAALPPGVNPNASALPARPEAPPLLPEETGTDAAPDPEPRVDIVAAAPPIDPPLRPETDTRPNAGADAEATFDGPRPRLRPEALVPDDAALEEATDAAGEAPVGPRPRMRPISGQQIATAERNAADPDAVSDLVMDRSRVPAARPPDFARTVEVARAQAAAASALASVPQQQIENAAPDERQTASLARPPVASTPAPEPDEVEDVPVAQTAAVVAPRIPSAASVAAQATVRNGLQFGRMNLIGVYGSSSNRRALVRLSSGRFVKVKVGDRLDGGQIAAISDSQIRYIKGGRSIVLSMPDT